MVSEKLTGWQPIETAPEEGGFLVAKSDMIGFALHGTRDLEKFPESGWSGNPTHWQPLPAPPGTTRAPADLRSALEAETIERKALHEILRVRPPGDVETCKVPRKLVEQMERIAMAALAPTKEPAA